MWREPVAFHRLPGLSTVGAAQQSAAAGRLRAVSARAERPALAAEIPGAGEHHFRILRIHRQARAARRGVARVAQDQGPALPAVAAAVDAALLAVAPELAGDARIDHVRALRVHEDAGDALGLGQAHVGPRLASVGGLVDTVADGDRVARPGLAGADPDGPRVARVDGDRADRLHRLLVEDGPEARAAVLTLPDAAARGADVDERLPVHVGRRDGGGASGAARISRVIVPCGYSNRASSTATFASAFSTVKCALRGAPFLPWWMEVGIQMPATWPYAPRSASVTCSLPRTRRSFTMRISRNASGSRKTYCTSPSFSATRSLWAGVPSTSSMPRYSTLLPFSRQETSCPSTSASCASARASSCEARSGSRRPPKGASFQPSLPFQACTAVRPCRVTSERIFPGRFCTCAHAISMLPPRRPMPPVKTARPVRRSDWSFCTLAAPPRAARFFARSSSRVTARPAPERANSANSRTRMGISRGRGPQDGPIERFRQA